MKMLALLVLIPAICIGATPDQIDVYLMTKGTSLREETRADRVMLISANGTMKIAKWDRSTLGQKPSDDELQSDVECLYLLSLPSKYLKKVAGKMAEMTVEEKAIVDDEDLDTTVNPNKWTAIDKARFAVLLEYINELRLTNGMAVISKEDARRDVKKEMKK